MKTNMTDKDKRLLTFMLMFVIIVAIGYWGVIPQITRYNELAEEIEKEEDTQKINKLKIQNAAMVEFSVEEYTNKIKQVKDEFYGIMNSSEVNQMLTQLATKRGLNIYDLSFSMPRTPTNRMAYVNSALYQAQLEAKQAYQSEDEEESSQKKDSSDKEDASDSKKSESTQKVMDSIMGGEEGAYAPNTDIFAVPVSFSVGGELSELEGFLDELNHFDKRVLMIGYSWGEYRTYVYRDANGNLVSRDGAGSIIPSEEGVTAGELAQDTKVRKALTVRLEIYMCDMTAVDDTSSLEEDTETEEVSE